MLGKRGARNCWLSGTIDKMRVSRGERTSEPLTQTALKETRTDHPKRGHFGTLVILNWTH